MANHEIMTPCEECIEYAYLHDKNAQQIVDLKIDHTLCKERSTCECEKKIAKAKEKLLANKNKLCEDCLNTPIRKDSEWAQIFMMRQRRRDEAIRKKKEENMSDEGYIPTYYLIAIPSDHFYCFAKEDQHPFNTFNEVMIEHRENCKFCSDHKTYAKLHLNHIELLTKVSKHFRSCLDPTCNCKKFVKSLFKGLDEIKTEFDVLSESPFKYLKPFF